MGNRIAQIDADVNPYSKKNARSFADVTGDHPKFREQNTKGERLVVNNIPKRNIINWLSKRQADILRVLGCPDVVKLRTSEIIDALGFERSPKNYASVSRSLRRMVAAKVIVSYVMPYSQGQGYKYGLKTRVPFGTPEYKAPVWEPAQ